LPPEDNDNLSIDVIGVDSNGVLFETWYNFQSRAWSRVPDGVTVRGWLELQTIPVAQEIPKGIKLCDCPECGAEIQYGLAQDAIDAFRKSSLFKPVAQEARQGDVGKPKQREHIDGQQLGDG